MQIYKQFRQYLNFFEKYFEKYFEITKPRITFVLSITIKTNNNEKNS